MRNLLYIGLLFILVVFSCEEDPIVYDTPNGFVQVQTESLSIVENSADPLTITVLLGDGENPNGVDVSYSIDAEDADRFDLSPANGTITIPAGEFSADLVLTPVDNFAVDGNSTVVITLTDSSDVPVGIAGQGAIATSTTVTIIDNDCPIDIDEFIGVFSVSEVFTSGTNEGLALSAAFGESYELTLTALPGDESGTKVVVANNTGFTYIADGTVITFDTCNGAVDFGGPTVEIALFADLTVESSSYSEEDNTITANGPLGGFGPYQFILTNTTPPADDDSDDDSEED